MKLAISVGELSADEHGAEVVKALRVMAQDLEVQGMGGQNLRRAGVKTIIDSERDASVMGFKEVLGSGAKVLRSFRAMENLLREWKPDALFLIDYAEFNMRLAKKAKALNIPVVYYIPPQMWAWRSGRVENLKKHVDKVALIFPFEKEFYRSRGYLNSKYVGHPFIDRYTNRSILREETRKALSVKDGEKLLAIFPGSRASEIERHVGVIKDAVAILRSSHEDILPILGVANSLSEKSRRILFDLERSFGIKTYEGNSFDLLAASDAGVIKSGTSNLQAAFAMLPFVMIYKASFLSEMIARVVVPTRTFSIVNVIRERTVDELIQRACTPKTIASSVEELLYDDTRRNKMLQGFKDIVETLSTFESASAFEGTKSVAERVAKMILMASLRRDTK